MSQNEEDFTAEQLERMGQESRALLGKARQESVSDVEYRWQESRLLSAYRERSAKRAGRTSWVWKFLTVAQALVLLYFLSGPYLGPGKVKEFPEVFAAKVDQPILVKVALQEVSRLEVARFEIVLPEGVVFRSKAHPELDGAQHMSLAWIEDWDKEELPFVVEAKNEGVKAVTVVFRDAEGSVVGSKTIHIRFS